MLRAEHLCVSYGAHRALEDISVHVARGEICVILGANGAGKTTLLNAIAGLVAPRDGARVTIGDTDITRAPANLVVEAGVALVPEGRGIFGDLTVRENLSLGAYGKHARAQSEERLKMVTALFPRLAERSGQVARTMSGGEQQMVAIGRALMSNPHVLMLDEPSLGLSPLLCTELFRSLRRIGETGTGILLVEQNARLSLSIADRAYLIENGHIVGEGKARALASDPAVQKAYLGGAGARTQRRFIEVHEPFHAQPARAALPFSAADLARRATEIQRAHIEARRIGAQAGAFERTGAAARQEASAPASPHANPISLAAGDMARRAAMVLADHIAARRPEPAPEPKALPAPPVADDGNLVVLSRTSLSKTPIGA
ncbi:MAG: ATP-binding cassette domain-containing protein [Alphaproteobacteria bacterium]|nr:ATP-binding cassette domain-containing protein [Alphaproteobacteria bacterium]